MILNQSLFNATNQATSHDRSIANRPAVKIVPQSTKKNRPRTTSSFSRASSRSRAVRFSPLPRVAVHRCRRSPGREPPRRGSPPPPAPFTARRRSRGSPPSPAPFTARRRSRGSPPEPAPFTARRRSRGSPGASLAAGAAPPHCHSAGFTRSFSRPNASSIKLFGNNNAKVQFGKEAQQLFTMTTMTSILAW
ncbi:serine/arginine repetitive matrix protein 1-like [Triticum urartu]|uniref:serine/arginine repetitive matrix protein 1-like n=1 Tax=Triticum urartu TaxID=4572 RepID=UPI002043A6B9|nr:serine/arginine repetitive matrix protein 1-like [Triticum urartu]